MRFSYSFLFPMILVALVGPGCREKEARREQVAAAPPPAAKPAKNPAYAAWTPSSVISTLSKDHAGLQFAPWQEHSEAVAQIREWEKKVAGEGKEGVLAIPPVYLNAFALGRARRMLGPEDGVTEDVMPGMKLLGAPGEIKGSYVWYGRVGLGFVQRLDADPDLNYVFALRFQP